MKKLKLRAVSYFSLKIVELHNFYISPHEQSEEKRTTADDRTFVKISWRELGLRFFRALPVARDSRSALVFALAWKKQKITPVLQAKGSVAL